MKMTTPGQIMKIPETQPLLGDPRQCPALATCRGSAEERLAVLAQLELALVGPLQLQYKLLPGFLLGNLFYVVITTIITIAISLIISIIVSFII
jgi:hypothetical protein